MRALVDANDPAQMHPGAAPILDFQVLGQSRAWGHGELGPPHPCRVGGSAQP